MEDGGVARANGGLLQVGAVPVTLVFGINMSDYPYAKLIASIV